MLYAVGSQLVAVGISGGSWGELRNGLMEVCRVIKGCIVEVGGMVRVLFDFILCCNMKYGV